MKERKFSRVMSKKQKFIEWITMNVNVDDMPEDVASYWNGLVLTKEKEKPAFTDNGKMILQFLQKAVGTHYTSKEIAEQITVSSRTVSGAMRKLVTDGYVEKVGADPVVYEITQKGKAVTWED